MTKKRICNIVLCVLCASGIIVNGWFEQYKAVSIVCMLGMGVITLVKERIE